MNSSNLLFLGVATVVVVIIAVLVPDQMIPWRTTNVARPQPGPPAEIDASLPEHRRLAEAYAAKLANPDYQALKSQPGLPSTYQDFPEEAEIKRVRAKLAAQLTPPQGVTLTRIPILKGPPPAIDGLFSPNEWNEAVEIPIGTNNAHTTLLIAADQKNLYLACDAPEETTENGYDQFRFYFHLDITPMIVNERVHVGTRPKPLGGIRQTHVRWQGPAPTTDNERWKKSEISDWKIYEHARGASAIDGHRRYEAVLELAETGLPVGVPFPAWSDVETDPAVNNRGQFAGRQYLGQLGAQTAPIWFVIQ